MPAPSSPAISTSTSGPISSRPTASSASRQSIVSAMALSTLSRTESPTAPRATPKKQSNQQLQNTPKTPHPDTPLKSRFSHPKVAPLRRSSVAPLVEAVRDNTPSQPIRSTLYSSRSHHRMSRKHPPRLKPNTSHAQAVGFFMRQMQRFPDKRRAMGYARRAVAPSDYPEIVKRLLAIPSKSDPDSGKIKFTILLLAMVS